MTIQTMRLPGIAFLSEHASPAALLGSVDAGGQNVYVDEIARNLAHQGYLVDVFTRRDSATAPEVINWAPGVRVINLEVGPRRFVPKDELWPYMPAFRDALLRFMEQSEARYDLVHGNFWMSGRVACELRSHLHIPAVQIFHALGKTKRLHQGERDSSPPERIEVEQQIIRTVDRLIAQCPAEWDELVHDYGALPEKVVTIPSAVNVQTFQPVARDEARRKIGLKQMGQVIVYVGRMQQRKDVRNVVRGLARLLERYPALGGPEDAPLRLLLVGGETCEPDPLATPEIGVLQRLAAELGVAERLIFMGKRQPDELRLYYSAGDLVVTTPWYEPFGLTPLEGMACGRPVVGSAVGGITFTIADGETGLLVPPRDPEALAEAFASLIAYPERCRQMGQAARQRVERTFTWPVAARQTAALYQSLLVRRDQGEPKQDLSISL